MNFFEHDENKIYFFNGGKGGAYFVEANKFLHATGLYDGNSPFSTMKERCTFDTKVANTGEPKKPMREFVKLSQLKAYAKNKAQKSKREALCKAIAVLEEKMKPASKALMEESKEPVQLSLIEPMTNNDEALNRLWAIVEACVDYREKFTKAWTKAMRVFEEEMGK